MSCKYCGYRNKEKFNYPVLDKSVNKDYIYIDIMENKLHVECELNYNSMLDSVNINYCPMCGQKLGGV